MQNGLWSATAENINVDPGFWVASSFNPLEGQRSDGTSHTVTALTVQARF